MDIFSVFFSFSVFISISYGIGQLPNFAGIDAGFAVVQRGMWRCGVSGGAGQRKLAFVSSLAHVKSLHISFSTVKLDW